MRQRIIYRELSRQHAGQASKLGFYVSTRMMGNQADDALVSAKATQLPRAVDRMKPRI
jgi:hypothetical protein